MRFPFILRSDHDKMMSQSNIIICDRENTIASLKFLINKYENEIQALMLQLTDTPQQFTPIKREKRTTVSPPSRSGWRARAQQASTSTIPAPKDSSKALEEKVIREGGTA